MIRPNIEEFDDVEVAIRHYMTWHIKMKQMKLLIPNLWYEVTLQTNTFIGKSVVTVNLGQDNQYVN